MFIISFKSNPNCLCSLVYICSTIGILPSSTRIGVGSFVFRFIHYPSVFQCLLSLTIITSSIIHTLTIPNSRTLLLPIAFLASHNLCGFASIIIIKECMTDNKVKLNYAKTEVMLISSSRMSTFLSIPDSFATGNTSVPFSVTINNII